MSHDRHDDFLLDDDDREAFLELSDRLDRERPVPRPAFRGELRRRLIAPRDAAVGPRRYRLLAASYAGTGLLCLMTAAVGLVGGGPFAA